MGPGLSSVSSETTGCTRRREVGSVGKTIILDDESWQSLTPVPDSIHRQPRIGRRLLVVRLHEHTSTLPSSPKRWDGTTVRESCSYFSGTVRCLRRDGIGPSYHHFIEHNHKLTTYPTVARYNERKNGTKVQESEGTKQRGQRGRKEGKTERG